MSGSDHPHAPEATAYEPIRDYEQAPRSLVHPELRQLSAIWDEQREALSDESAVESFNQRLRREWSIETGLLERAYTLDRGLLRLLVERGIDSSLLSHQSIRALPRRILETIRDHEEAFEKLFDFTSGGQPLTKDYILALHAILMRTSRDTKAIGPDGQLMRLRIEPGRFKTEPNNPVNNGKGIATFCPPDMVEAEIERLIEMHHSHTDTPAEVEGAWLHHRFTQIHPFQDGNGRVARCLATLVFLRAGWFPLVIRDLREERRRYLEALQSADGGDLAPLTHVFTMAQKRAIVQALGISGQILKRSQAPAFGPQPDDLTMPSLSENSELWIKTRRTAARLQKQAQQVLVDTARRLESECQVNRLPGQFSVDFEPPDGPRAHECLQPVLETAHKLDYTADPNDYHAWSRLILHAHDHVEFLLSFHCIGSRAQGLLVASACSFRRVAGSNGSERIVELTPLSEDLFQINYRDVPQDASIRFSQWFTAAIDRGLHLWRQRRDYTPDEWIAH